MRKTLLAGASLAILFSAASVRAETINIEPGTTINSAETTKILAEGDIVNITEGININGTHDTMAGEEPAQARNGITSTTGNLGTVNISGGTTNITDGGSIEVKDVAITGGTINIDGYNASLPTQHEKELWRKGSLLSGSDSLSVENAEVNLDNGGILATWRDSNSGMSLGEGSKINMNNGIIRTDTLTMADSAQMTINKGTIYADSVKVKDSLLAVNGELIVDTNKVADNDYSAGTITLQTPNAEKESILALAGTIKGNVEGDGVAGNNDELHIMSSNAAIDGTLSGTDINFYADKKLSEVATGSVSNMGVIMASNGAHVIADATGTDDNGFNQSASVVVFDGGQFTVAENYTASSSDKYSKVKTNGAMNIAAGKTFTATKFRLEDGSTLNIDVANAETAGD